MNRNTEYKDLLSELESTPPELQGVVSSAKSRRSRVVRGKHVGATMLSTLAVLMVAFSVGANTIPAFAQAISKVPVLRELASAVAWSPSLKSAVENDYYQKIGQEQTINGVTMRLDYAIVDQEQLHIFWNAQSDKYPHPFVVPDIEVGGSPITAGVGTVYDEKKPDQLHEISWKLEGNAPDQFVLVCKVHNYEDYNAAVTPPPEKLDENGGGAWRADEYPEPEPLAVFRFPIKLNLDAVEKNEEISIDQSFEIDGKTITATDAQISPTQMKVNFITDDLQEMKLENLLVYAIDGDGNKLEGDGDWQPGTGTQGDRYSVMLESPFFAENKNLTLHVEGAVWKLSKEEKFKLDLEKETAEGLPETLTLDSITKKGKNCEVIITAQSPGKVKGTTFDFYKTAESLGVADEEAVSLALMDMSDSGFPDPLKLSTWKTIKTKMIFHEYPSTVDAHTVLFRSTQPESPIEIRLK